MLAAPRRKQKVINLRAKNSEWSNDANKFGQRMLEKMGWSSGKGLGANEDGMVEHVIARYKNDEKGLGFEDKNDQWTKHEDDFNALLANLSNGDKNEIKLHSGVSLEVKSKKSKARVHYHKFTRGKDLTRYSEKDLANIFGKKTLKVKKDEEPTHAQEEKVEELKSEQVFTEKGSMEDYFKNKLAALKSKNISLTYEKEDYEADYGFQGFSGAAESDDQQNVGFQGFSFYNNENEQSNQSITVEPELKKTKKNKKSKKKDDKIKDTEIQDTESTVEFTENHSESIEDEPQPTKKKKSKKNKNKPEIIPEDTEKIKKKKSKIESAEDIPEEDYHVPKKKKKRKNKVE